MRTLSDAFVDDGECGVHWMANEKSERFAREYPRFLKEWDKLAKETR